MTPTFIDEDNPLWGFFALILGIVCNRLISGKYPWESEERRRRIDEEEEPNNESNAEYLDQEQREYEEAMANVAAWSATCPPPSAVAPPRHDDVENASKVSRRRRRQSRQQRHHEPLSSSSTGIISGIEVRHHFGGSRRPLLLPRGDRHEEQALSDNKELKKKIRESNKRLGEGKYHKDWMEKKVLKLTRSKEQLKKTLSDCEAEYQAISPSPKENAKTFQKVLADERMMKESMKKYNASVMSKISGSKKERVCFRRSVRALADSVNTNLLRKQRITHKMATEGHRMNEKLRESSSLCKQIQATLCEKDDLGRHLQGEILNLQSQYVTEMDYGRQLDQLTLAKSSMISLGRAMFWGLHAIAFVFWTFKCGA